MNQLIRRAAVGALLGYSVLLAHAIGGAGPTFPLILLAAMFTAFALHDGLEIGGPKLAIFLLAFQIIGHFTMPDGGNGARMQYSHLLAAFITYQILTKFDRAVIALSEKFLPIEFNKKTIIPTFTIAIFPKLSFFNFKYVESAINRRGPPLLGGAM